MVTRRAVVLALAAGLAACGGPAAPPLPAAAIDVDRVAVAGLSSGAYMATQVHVALSSRVHGAALFAGGPYGCARGDLEVALGACMAGTPVPSLEALVEAAKAKAASGAIDPLAGLGDDRVFVFHGARDGAVAPGLAAATEAVYRGLSGDDLALTVDAGRPVGHLLPTLDAGGDCLAPASPYLGRCGIDGAGLAMAALFGPPPAPAADRATGAPVAFDQRALLPEGGAEGLARSGYAYVPEACAAGGCGALLVFHGCQQDAASVGDAFVRDAGFNRWADVYRLIVVYPQTRSSYVPLNPKSCWDWWGYGGADYDTRAGGQVAFVARVLDRLAER